MEKVFIGDNYYAIVELPWNKSPNLDHIKNDLKSGKAMLAIWFSTESMFYKQKDFVLNTEYDTYETNPLYRSEHEMIANLLFKYNLDEYVLIDNNPYNEIRFSNNCIYVPNYARKNWEECDAKESRDAVFSSFNRRPSRSRLTIVDHIHTKDSVWSCGELDEYQKHQLPQFNHLDLPKVVDKEFTPLGTGMVTPYWLYQTAYFHIINETDTWYDPNYLFVTEKTYNCINSRTPFLMAGQPYTLRHLKELGFKTFSDYWDESYDEELYTTKRIDMICNLIDTIEKDYMSLFKEVKDICEYNYNHLRTFDYSLESKLSTFGFK
jgi:hypothetical protein